MGSNVQVELPTESPHEAMHDGEGPVTLVEYGYSTSNPAKSRPETYVKLHGKPPPSLI